MTLDTTSTQPSGTSTGFGISDLTTFVELTNLQILLKKIGTEEVFDIWSVVKISHGVSRIDGLIDIEESKFVHRVVGLLSHVVGVVSGFGRNHDVEKY